MSDHSFFSQVAKDFVGVDTCYSLADGSSGPRHYLDSAASTLMMRSAFSVMQRFLEHYGNTHSDLHFGARVASSSFAWAHEQVLQFLKASPDEYVCVFGGQGATFFLNRLSRQLSSFRSKRRVVLVSEMEHHSNDLPHRRFGQKVVHFPLEVQLPAAGAVDVLKLQSLVEEFGEAVNYVAVTASSNVTGVVNPLSVIADLVHGVGGLLVIDASQLVAHAPLSLADGSIDCLVFSGHKVYAPGSPGVLVIRKSLLEQLEPDDVGGGIVEDVFVDDFQLCDDLSVREEAGTPNLPGAVLLGAALSVLEKVGLDVVHEHEFGLLQFAEAELAKFSEVRFYGVCDEVKLKRTGILAFNVVGVDHGLVAAVLNDFHNVAVRHACFCAHPYVRNMLKPELWDLDLDPDKPEDLEKIGLKRGMVRASFGIYNGRDDVLALVKGVRDIIDNQAKYRELYVVNAQGEYEHKSFKVSGRSLFDPSVVLDECLKFCPEDDSNV